jgi:hypothetical protein
MFDPFFAWLESTSLNAWIVTSPSLFAFPGILASHTIGLALVVGLAMALDLRLLGVAPNIPPAAFTRVVPIMWFGLWLNVITGVALLVAYPTKALTNPVFYLKLTLIGAGLQILRTTLRHVREGLTLSHATTRLAALSLVIWIAAITSGRLLAYTCTRLTVEYRCE